MRLEELDFSLPPEQIAQFPAAKRSDSRLLVVSREQRSWEEKSFRDLASLLRGDELLVLNNARVIPARLLGRKKAPRTNVAVEFLLTRELEAGEWEALVRPGKKLRAGDEVAFGGGELEAEILTSGESGMRTVRFRSSGNRTVAEELERLGHVPLPPYITREDEPLDRERYQTVFASRQGAIAAPTAGLHFTQEILESIRARGAEICELTLQVGLGTFQPIRGETLEGHKIHPEGYEIPMETAEKIENARTSGRRVIAVGTTVVRALEDAAARAGKESRGVKIPPGRAEARIFITPGHTFRVVDSLLTNFHLPRSTLLALVCAVAGRELILGAYRHAVEHGFRFYSYGDCMLIR